MQLKSLRLSQIRGFEQGEFEFNPGMNLIVGVNGAGKSTVLDVLCILGSQFLLKLSQSKSKRLNFRTEDIMYGRGALTAQLMFNIDENDFKYLAHKPREIVLINKDKEGEVRGQTTDLIEHYDLDPLSPSILKKVKEESQQPLLVYYAPNRSILDEGTPKQEKSGGKYSLAYADALVPHRLNIKEYALWWLAQDELLKEKPELSRLIEQLRNVVTQFLETCTDLHPIKEPAPTLIIQKNGFSLDVKQLSDGERGLLSLILDLARRLAIANPDLSDPLTEGKAVVLIDELDIHLHPGWQRDVVQKLTNTFPKCQFIATTHSPQILGEVPPENIYILEAGKAPYRPDQSLGMDSNWILEILMGTSDRKKKYSQQLERISKLINNKDFSQARDNINILRSEIGDFPELVKLETRLHRILTLGK
jgi:predicted ATP-binding protein involved in virulence